MLCRSHGVGEGWGGGSPLKGRSFVKEKLKVILTYIG